MRNEKKDYWLVIGRGPRSEAVKIVLLLWKNEARTSHEAVRKGMQQADLIEEVDVLRWRFAACLIEEPHDIGPQSKALCDTLRSVGIRDTPKALRSNILLIGAKMLHLKQQAFARRLYALRGTIH